MGNLLMTNTHPSHVERESNLGGSYVMVSVPQETEQKSPDSGLSMEESIMSLVVVEHPYEEREKQESEEIFGNLNLSQQPFLITNW